MWARLEIMGTARYVYWQDGDQWIGYFEDYMTQGESIEDLQDHRKDLFLDLTGGEIPGIRRVGGLSLT